MLRTYPGDTELGGGIMSLLTSRRAWSTFPSVTTVVPTHRRPELMRQAVQSVFDQDYPGHIEVLIVFDACAPQLPEIKSSTMTRRSVRAIVNELLAWTGGRPKLRHPGGLPRVRRVPGR